MSTEVGKTILQQLGGQRFITMTGARNFIAHEDGLSFRLPNSQGRKLLQDHAHPGGSLHNEVHPHPWIESDESSSLTDLDAEDLQSTFTRSTGLDTHL